MGRRSQSKTGQKRKILTNRLDRIGLTKLLSWGPRDFTDKWLTTSDDMSEFWSYCRFRTCKSLFTLSRCSWFFNLPRHVVSRRSREAGTYSRARCYRINNWRDGKSHVSYKDGNEALNPCSLLVCCCNFGKQITRLCFTRFFSFSEVTLINDESPMKHLPICWAHCYSFQICFFSLAFHRGSLELRELVRMANLCVSLGKTEY